MTEPTGSLTVLNVGAGDIEILFNQHDDREARKAIAMLKEMQGRGYAILVRDAEGTYQRAHAIDASRGRYILQLPDAADVPPDAEVVTCLCGCGARVSPGKQWLRGHHHRGRAGTGKKRAQVSVPVKGRHATGVARSAGG